MPRQVYTQLPCTNYTSRYGIKFNPVIRLLPVKKSELGEFRIEDLLIRFETCYSLTWMACVLLQREDEIKELIKHEPKVKRLILSGLARFKSGKRYFLDNRSWLDCDFFFYLHSTFFVDYKKIGRFNFPHNYIRLALSPRLKIRVEDWLEFAFTDSFGLKLPLFNFKRWCSRGHLIRPQYFLQRYLIAKLFCLGFLDEELERYLFECVKLDDPKNAIAVKHYEKGLDLFSEHAERRLFKYRRAEGVNNLIAQALLRKKLRRGI